MSTEIVAWAQCRAANGQLRNFCGFVKGELDNILSQSASSAVLWAQNAQIMADGFVDGVSASIMRLQNAGADEMEFIPLPRLEGEVTEAQVWQRLVSVTGVVNIYGISISCAPDAALSGPGNPLPANGAVAFHTAAFDPPSPMYALVDMPAPKYHFCRTLWFGSQDKPISAFTSPWTLGLDDWGTPKFLEGENWNCNIPIAKYRIPPLGFSIWGFWAEQSLPKLKVTVVTGPEVDL